MLVEANTLPRPAGCGPRGVAGCDIGCAGRARIAVGLNGWLISEGRDCSSALPSSFGLVISRVPSGSGPLGLILDEGEALCCGYGVAEGTFVLGSCETALARGTVAAAGDLKSFKSDDLCASVGGGLTGTLCIMGVCITGGDGAAGGICTPG